MPLLVPYVTPPSPPVVPAVVVAPAFKVTFYYSGGSYVLTTVKAIQTSLGRTSPRSDATAAGQATLTVTDTNRVLDADNASSPLAGKLTSGDRNTTVQVTVWNGSSFVPLFTGLIEDIVTTWPGGTKYSEARVQLVDQQRDVNLVIPAAGTLYPQQLTGARIGQLLGAPGRGGWGWLNRSRSGAFALDPGQKLLAPVTADGVTSAWAYAAASAAAEKGLVFFGPDGVPQFHDQHRRYLSSTPVWTFGDNAGEIAYDPELSLSQPNDRTIGDVAYATADGRTAGYGPGGAFSWLTANSDAARVNTSATDVPLSDVYQGAARAQWEYERYTVNRRDAPQLVINGMGEWPSLTSPSRFACAIGAQISDYCAFNRRPGGTTIAKKYWLDGIAHDIRGGPDAAWQTTFTMVAADTIVQTWRLGVDRLQDIQGLQW